MKTRTTRTFLFFFFFTIASLVVSTRLPASLEIHTESVQYHIFLTTGSIPDENEELQVK